MPDQQQRLQGVKGYLSNILHGFGEGVKANLGMETDAQQQQRLFTQNLQTQNAQAQQANIQSEIAQRAAQVKQMQSMVTLPNGTQVPFALAKPYIEAQAKIEAVRSGKRFVVVPNVGLMDTQADGGPQLVPGSSASGIKITPEMVTSNGIPAQLVGKTITLGQYAQLERGGAAFSGTVTNTTETKELGNGSVVQIPKTTVTKKIGPNATSATAPASSPGAPSSPGPVSLNTKGGVKTLVGPDGQPLQGKSAVDNVYATDPKTGQQIFTTRSDANAQGFTAPMKVTAAQVEKDKGGLKMLNDVQMNASRYNVAARDYFKNGGDYGRDGPLLSKLISENPFTVSSGGLNLHLPAADIMNNIENSKAYTALTPAGKELMDGWLRANAAVPAYQKALTNIGRANKEMMDLELKNIPSPILGVDDIQRRMKAFQENIDQANNGFPKFPDVPNPRDIRSKLEGQSGASQKTWNPVKGRYE
jgi:hypothetical protein